VSDTAGTTPTEGRTGASKSLVLVGLEAALISAGVFLGLMGDQWREDTRRREAAEGALARFRTELVANREAVMRVDDYHVELKTSLDAYFAADQDERDGVSVRMQGLLPAAFDHSAWDLAIGSQALSDIDPELALGLSRIYRAQEMYAGLSTGVIEAMYLIPREESPSLLLRAFWSYLGDIVILEPELLRMYDEIVPVIDAELGDSAP
jgi:hypothetical protein